VAEQNHFGVLSNMLLDFQHSAVDLKTSGAMYGCAPFTNEASYYSRSGAAIANTGRLTVCLPLAFCLGTLMGKSFPLGAIRADVKVEIKLASHLNWGVYTTDPSKSPTIEHARLQMQVVNLSDSAETMLVRQLPVIYCPTGVWHSAKQSVPAGSQVSFNIPFKMASCNALFCVLRDTENLDKREKNSATRTLGGATRAYLQIGSHRYPQDGVRLDYGGNEARAELMKALGSFGSQSIPSALSAAQYSTEGFAFGLSLETFGGMSDILSDGMRLTDMSTILYIDTSSAKGMELTVFAHADMVLEVANNGMVSYFQ